MDDVQASAVGIGHLAVVTGGDGPRLVRRPVPTPDADEVVLAVRACGVCRTDLAAAAGRLSVPEGRILGHEVAGEVIAVGPGVSADWVGAAVGVRPWRCCGRCAPCREGRDEACIRREMLGVARDGGFAERVCVPVDAVLRLPHALPWTTAAYLEPVAAALAACSVVPEGARGVVWGTNRIARLTVRVLRARGFAFDLHDPADADPQGVPVIVEAGVDDAALDRALRALRPGGLLVAKSRHQDGLRVDFALVAGREIQIRGANYGRFDEALALLVSGQVSVADLVGESYPLAAFDAAFAAASRENDKPFLVP